MNPAKLIQVGTGTKILVNGRSDDTAEREVKWMLDIKIDQK